MENKEFSNVIFNLYEQSDFDKAEIRICICAKEYRDAYY